MPKSKYGYAVLVTIAALAISIMLLMSNIEQNRFYALIAVTLGIAFLHIFALKEEETTISGKVVKKNGLLSGRVSLQFPSEKEEEESCVKNFASEMKELFDALVAVGFNDEQAVMLIEATENVCQYDDIEEFAEDLWELFNTLVAKGFKDEHALRLTPLYWI